MFPGIVQLAVQNPFEILRGRWETLKHEADETKVYFSVGIGQGSFKILDQERSIQAFDRSITHLAIAGTKPDFSYFEGFFDNSKRILVMICG